MLASACRASSETRSHLFQQRTIAHRLIVLATVLLLTVASAQQATADPAPPTSQATNVRAEQQPLPLRSDTDAPVRIAVIGSGISGSATAYFIRSFFDGEVIHERSAIIKSLSTKADPASIATSVDFLNQAAPFKSKLQIDMYEKGSVVGGRISNMYHTKDWSLNGTPFKGAVPCNTKTDGLKGVTYHMCPPEGSTDTDAVELGGSIIHSSNRYMTMFTDLLGLERIDPPMNGERVMIRNGSEILYESSIWQPITIARLLWRYGLSLPRLRTLVKAFINKFERVYTLQAAQSSDPRDGRAFRRVEDLLEELELKQAVNSSLVELLLEGLGNDDYTSRLVNEFVAGMTRVNYNQSPYISGLAGLVALAPSTDGDVYAVRGGNARVIERLLTLSGVHVKLNTRVTAIDSVASQRKQDPFKYEVSFASPSQQQATEIYDYVVVATPFQNSGPLLTPTLMPDKASQLASKSFHPRANGKDADYGNIADHHLAIMLGPEFPQRQLPDARREYQVTFATFIEGVPNTTYFAGRIAYLSEEELQARMKREDDETLPSLTGEHAHCKLSQVTDAKVDASEIAGMMLTTEGKACNHGKPQVASDGSRAAFLWYSFSSLSVLKRKRGELTELLRKFQSQSHRGEIDRYAQDYGDRFSGREIEYWRVKIFSKGPLSPTFIDTLFPFKSNQVRQIIWWAYPRFSKTTTFSPFQLRMSVDDLVDVKLQGSQISENKEKNLRRRRRARSAHDLNRSDSDQSLHPKEAASSTEIDSRVFYVNALEHAVSTMETQCVAARNVAMLISKDVLHKFQPNESSEKEKERVTIHNIPSEPSLLNQDTLLSNMKIEFVKIEKLEL